MTAPRATAEQDDPDARLAISGSITDLEQYEVIYVGYPIWLAYHDLIQWKTAEMRGNKPFYGFCGFMSEQDALFERLARERNITYGFKPLMPLQISRAAILMISSRGIFFHLPPIVCKFPKCFVRHMS